MKKIQRYTVGTADPEAIVEDNKGWLVSYDDYADLQAENERLQELCRGYSGHNQRIIKRAMEEEVELLKLRAENERLRKAGDAMAAIIRPPAHGPGEWDGEYDEWQIAKGVQS